MDEIEKMYENAGVEKEFEKPAECTKNPYITCDGCMLYDDKKGKCNNRKGYPPFTAEKQLKLIEFMLKKYGEETIGFELWKDNSYHAMCHLGYDGFENYAASNTLCGAIAGLITLYWQDLTEEEKQQVKGILE